VRIEIKRGRKKEKRGHKALLKQDQKEQTTDKK
jgi:hypothetical protein